MKRRNDENDAASDDSSEQESEQGELESEQDSSADETDTDGAKRFERSDNLRRRSEWFQKRTGGR